jgi:hypothetical protein
MQAFPDSSSVARLRRLGVRTVVLHPNLARATPWQRTAKRSVRGLPLRRERRAQVVVYQIASR